MLAQLRGHRFKRGFCAFALDGVRLFVFEQRSRQASEFSAVLDCQYGATFLLRLSHVRLLPVEAPNEKAAEAAAVAEFDLSDEQRRRLVVQQRN